MHQAAITLLFLLYQNLKVLDVLIHNNKTTPIDSTIYSKAHSLPTGFRLNIKGLLGPNMQTKKVNWTPKSIQGPNTSLNRQTIYHEK